MLLTAKRLHETLDHVADEWQLADAWVLASIEGTGAEEWSDLARILIKAEAINHAGLGEEEFSRAVPRLLAAGLIGADPAQDRYWRTAAGEDLYRKAMRRRGLFGWIDALPPALQRLGPPQDSGWSLPAGTYDNAALKCRETYRALSRQGRRQST